ncbi:MAG: TIGR00266 family protein [Bryobacteraceae bacterium]
MAFCTACGTQTADGARFCPGCGASITGAPAGYATQVAVSSEPIEYEIHGDNLQVARVKLRPGQEVYAEAGKMVYKTASVSFETRMSGESIGEKLWGALKRKVMGESLFMTYFRASSNGEVGFAGDYPGRLQAFHLKPGQSWLVQRDSFIAAENSVQLNIALVKKLGAGFFGGEGFILERLTGPGIVFIHAGGDHLEFNLGPGETMQVDTGCLVGFEESVQYDIQFVGGVKTALFGGEGLFLATITGPGRVIIQSMTLEKLRRELSPGRSGGDERGALDALGGIFGSED